MSALTTSQIAAGDVLTFNDVSGQSVEAEVTNTDESSQQVTAIIRSPNGNVQPGTKFSINLDSGDVVDGSITSGDGTNLVITLTGITSSFNLNTSAGTKGGGAGGGIRAAIDRKKANDPNWKYKPR
ncbi:hypothetical protein [Pseudomonas yamanorum]|uniref:hypothetical protein n=1 Tax=Pseudomonas yamanorum TaxID=515393 RepID=UPI003B9E3C0E